jgi:hypothetical protein
MKKIELLIQDEISESIAERATGHPDTEGFPRTEKMYERKEAVLSYIKEAAGKEGLSLPTPKPAQPRPPYQGAFIDACHRVSAYTYKKHRRLLL